MSKNVVVIGTQWGDEGKGKIVDWLTDHAHAVVRFQGGHNAGHTLVIGQGEKQKEYKLTKKDWIELLEFWPLSIVTPVLLLLIVFGPMFMR